LHEVGRSLCSVVGSACPESVQHSLARFENSIDKSRLQTLETTPLGQCLNLFELRPHPLPPPNVTHVMNAPGLPRFSQLFSFCVLLSMPTEEQKQGRPGNKVCQW